MNKMLVLFAISAALVCAADKKAAPAKKAPPKQDAPQQAAAQQAAAVKPAGDSNGQGADMGGGAKACVPGDRIPVGSVVAGLKKVVGQTPFGDVCRWEPVKPQDETAGGSSGANTEVPAAPPASDANAAVRPPGDARSLGADMGGGVKACLPGDRSPAGSVVAGLKKVVSQTPFGDVCRWEPAK